MHVNVQQLNGSLCVSVLWSGAFILAHGSSGYLLSCTLACTQPAMMRGNQCGERQRRGTEESEGGKATELLAKLDGSSEETLTDAG